MTKREELLKESTSPDREVRGHSKKKKKKPHQTLIDCSIDMPKIRARIPRNRTETREKHSQGETGSGEKPREEAESITTLWIS